MTLRHGPVVLPSSRAYLKARLLPREEPQGQGWLGREEKMELREGRCPFYTLPIT
jgi:hypothetical protein